MSEADKTYSITLRLRRVIHEDAYISVPVDEKVLKKNEDGNYGVDSEKIFSEAIRMSNAPDVEWQFENSIIEAHPIQKPKPDSK